MWDTVLSSCSPLIQNMSLDDLLSSFYNFLEINILVGTHFDHLRNDLEKTV